MSPESNQILNCINSLNSLIDRIFPPGQLTRRVDVVGLDVGSEMFLRLSVEFDHSIGETISHCSQT